MDNHNKLPKGFRTWTAFLLYARRITTNQYFQYFNTDTSVALSRAALQEPVEATTYDMLDLETRAYREQAEFNQFTANQIALITDAVIRTPSTEDSREVFDMLRAWLCFMEEVENNV